MKMQTRTLLPGSVTEVEDVDKYMSLLPGSVTEDEDVDKDHEGPSLRHVPLTLPAPRVGEPYTLQQEGDNDIGRQI